ncbi:MAG: hypothetical protein GWO11_03330 [Desulfuromonadales bacterium]|nr:hypothetical protein [Desulfuromonadales bacterium]NIR33490.1 hypothetical protein [Desulfuromonadales bacterium]NIS43088.1 hypothetical protein [Desulfuromonadales bacterium]
MHQLSRSGFRLAVLALFFTLSAATALANTVPAKLAAARLAAEQGHGGEASSLYEEYIGAHPMMQSVFVSKDERLPPSQVHNLLLAFAELTELYRLSGDEQARSRYLDRLDWLKRNRTIGAINLYHLGRVYMDNGRVDQGLDVLAKITGDQERFPREEHNKVYLRACAKLLKTQSQQGRPDEVEKVLARMRRSLGLFNYDLRDRYKVARLFLEHGSPKNAEPILADIAAESDPAVLRVDEFTIVQASIKLLGLYAGRNDSRAIDRLLEKLLDKYADRPMTSRNRYLLALAMDRVGRAAAAKNLLRESR